MNIGGDYLTLGFWMLIAGQLITGYLQQACEMNS